MFEFNEYLNLEYPIFLQNKEILPKYKKNL